MAFLGRDNTGSQKRDPGDQLGGIDLQIPPGEMPIALYGQVISRRSVSAGLAAGRFQVGDDAGLMVQFSMHSPP
ncbi:hypothetical protein DA103_09705 [Enterobacter cloacae]|uniref:Uncharacterized protein n=1 Tax=Enterobacter cloacae TaxID=550 RepID=A0A2T4Y1J9_ENTCL|nr:MULTISPECIES: hypothetical protein [Enterobacter]MBO4146416.1 hypothetical protein [Enterobacter ludwigii]MCR1338557.1 capsule assembly Wzi family protein [Enterobacter sp. BT223]PTM36032.1 hypothetical protein DA103_09705 [Enterobacter cloacae]RWS57010.1 hypothetical protein DN586_09255 [Enterobacter cloacae]UOY72501.1 capsule assembly Wzi family protein [Enterobacter ludwigii]